MAYGREDWGVTQHRLSHEHRGREVSKLFLTYFDYFFRGVNENLGVERHQRVNR